MWSVGIFPGKVEVEVTSADREGMLRRLEALDITVYHVVDAGNIDLRFRVDRKDLTKLRAVLQARGDTVRIRWGRGTYRIVGKLFRRPVLTLGLAGLLALTLHLPTKVLIIEVEGAVDIPERQLLAEAALCGLHYGTSRKDIRSEQVKNRLLESLPELQWVGVNTYGCRAVISVKERAVQNEDEERKGVAHVVSLVDGVVRTITVTKGTAMCAPGDTVSHGQVLISGYSDRGLFVRGEVAEGEVFGETEHAVTTVIPMGSVQKTGTEVSDKNICLILGKKRIFFSKGSGISDASCGKMYTEHYVTLPGDIRLPIGIGVEQITCSQTTERSISAEEAETLLMEQAEDHLMSRMISGRILHREEECSAGDGAYVLQGRYRCNEMIGITRIEENFEHYETDRTERERGES